MVAEEMWNHLETERKVSVVSANGIKERTRWVDRCGREVGSGGDGGVGRVMPRSESRRGGVGNVAPESRVSISEFEVSGVTHREISPGAVSPLMRRRQASWVSWIISMAYFLFLASPEKANWFSGLPSGIL